MILLNFFSLFNTRIRKLDHQCYFKLWSKRFGQFLTVITLLALILCLVTSHRTIRISLNLKKNVVERVIENCNLVSDFKHVYSKFIINHLRYGCVILCNLWQCIVIHSQWVLTMILDRHSFERMSYISYIIYHTILLLKSLLTWYSC